MDGVGGAGRVAVGRRTDVVAGRFALDQPIATGGSGTVWTAHDLKLDKRCAAKVLRRRDGGDVLRFAREQAVRLHHPHVLTPYSWAAEDEHVVIATELVSGGSLATLSGDWGPLAEPTVVEVLRQLLVALEHVHAIGLVHRDVKPANVLLRCTGTGPLDVLLGDFGLAQRADDARLTAEGTVIGTPGFLAPEVYRSDVAPAPAQDLYALGQLAATLLTGDQPDRTSREHWLRAVRDPVLARTLTALTATDPDDRPRGAAEAARLLEGAHGDPVPRTADGEPVDVLDQLHHLDRPDQPDTPPATTPRAALDDPPRAGRTAVLAAPDLPAAPAPGPRARRSGRRPLVAALAVVLLGAVATAVLGAATAGSGDGGPGAATTTGTTDSRAGTACTWQQAGEEAEDGRVTVRCSRTSSGGYTWTPTGR